MEYIYLAGACLCFSIQFIFNKLFESRSNGTYTSGLWCALVTALCMLAYLLPAGGFTFAVSASAIACSLLYTLSSLLCSGMTVLALRRGKISVVTTYTLLGGLILPFLWGILVYGEPVTLTKILGIIILILSMVSSMVLDMHADKAAASEKKSGGMTINKGMIQMVGGFTVLRLTGMLSMVNVHLNKEDLLEINRKLNKIRKPKR